MVILNVISDKIILNLYQRIILKNIFIATPITSLLDNNGKMPILYQESLEYIYSKLENYGNIFCAIREEKWGELTPDKPIYTKRDFNKMKKSDFVLVFPGHSYGVCIEIGWASVLNKKILIIINENQKLTTPLLEGLSSISNVKILTMKSKILPTKQELDEYLFSKILTYI